MALWPWISDLQVLAGCECDPKHQPYFGSAGSQEGWFLGKSVYQNTTMTQLDPSLPIAVPWDYEKLFNVDMVTFINHNMGNRRYYCRVKDKRYINTNRTDLYIEVEPFQTYMFDLEFKGSFVEREMAENDWATVPSVNTIEEGLQLGDYVQAGETAATGDFAPWPLLFYVADGDGKPLTGASVDGVYSAARFASGESACNAIIAQYEELGLLDAIIGVVLIPGWMLAGSGSYTGPANLATWYDGYQPKNSKCFNYPFNLLSVECPGSSGEFHYELFSSPDSPSFRRDFSISLQPHARLAPENYRGRSLDSLNGVHMSDFPMAASSGNSFANWLANNKSSLLTGLAKSIAVGAAGGFAVGGAIGAAAGAVAGAAPTIGSLVDKQVNQTQQTTAPSGSVGYIKWGDYYFRMCQMQIESSCIQAVDDYFTAFGYKTNRAKMPNLRTRPFWNYVKLKDACIHLPAERGYQTEVETMFNNGVTLWHVDQGAVIGDYTMDNRG